MTPAQAADLLGFMAAFDQRTVGRSDALAWGTALSHIDYDDAREAVVWHYQHSRDRMVPMDVIVGVRRIHTQRIQAAGDPPPDADPNDPGAYLDAIRQQRREVASSELKPRPIAELIAANPIGVIEPVDYNGPQARQRRKQAAMLAVEASKQDAADQAAAEREERRRFLEEREAAIAEARAKATEAADV